MKTLVHKGRKERGKGRREEGRKGGKDSNPVKLP